MKRLLFEDCLEHFNSELRFFSSTHPTKHLNFQKKYIFENTYIAIWNSLILSNVSKFRYYIS